MNVQNARFLLLSLAIAQGCSSDGKDVFGDTGFGSAQVNGVIFKGPFQAGSTLTLTPYTDALEPNGDPVSISVDADDGSYSADLDFNGLVLVEAEGYALDESRGEEGPTALTLSAYAVLGDGEAELQVNILTDLVRQRVEALIASGAAPSDAISQAEDELTAALPVGAGGPPDAPGTALNPYGDGYGQAWLFGVSAVLAQAGQDMETVGTGSLGQLLFDLREDLADDGTLTEPLTQAIYLAEEHLDPDLATLALRSTLDAAGTGQILPDLHAALDTDHDGRPNNDDNCRYVANADQTDSLGLGFGDACDYRLTGVSVNDTWGCGLLVSDGAPVCWAVDAEPTGGTPPAPDVYPAHATTPWEGEDKLMGAYTQISVGQRVTCALDEAGAAHCDVDGVATELVLDGTFTQIVASETTICALDSYGALACFDTDGDEIVSEEGPFQDVDVFTDGGICTLDEAGDLAWVDYPGAVDGLPALPDGAFAALDATEAGVGCAISAYDGALSCFGNATLAADAPAGAFVEVATGSGVACAADASGALSCWRDETLCPEVEEAPARLSNLSAGGCQVCGLDDDGIGQCWPRLWSVDHPPSR